MADINALQDALVKADAAGNADDARALAGEIVRMRSAPAPDSNISPAMRLASMPASGLVDSVTGTVAAIPEMVASGLRKIPGIGPYLAPSPGYYQNELKDALAAPGKALGSVAGYSPEAQPAPETTAEKALYGIGHGVGDAASVVVPATAVANTAKAGSMTEALANALKAQPVNQMVSSGIGEGAGDATSNPLIGALAGLGTAGLTGGVKAAIDNAGAKKAFINSAPTTQALKDQATSAYKAADDAGLVVSAGSFGNAVNDIRDTAVKAGIDKDIHPKATAVLNRLSEESDTPKTLQDLDILRRVAKSAAGSNEPDERRIGSIIVGKLDDYVGGLKPDDVLAGDSQAANDALTSARQTWQQKSKSDLIQGIIDKAQNQASGVENGLRIGFRQLLNNKKALRGFSDDEISAMQDVADGTATGNTLRRLGKFSFGTGVQSNVLGGSAGAYLAHMMMGGAAGPAAFAVPLAGYAAQKGSQALTSNAAKYARALVASGGKGVADSGPMLIGDQTKGLNAALLAKILAEQSRIPSPNYAEVQK